MSSPTLRWVALGCLVMQNSMLSICMRFSRISNGHEGKYITSTAVVMAEIIKLIAASVIVFKEQGYDFNEWKAELYACFTEDPLIMVKLMVPSILYTVQNNLQYVAISNLHPAMFQVLYQMKLLTTAAISYCLLNKQLSFKQWGSLLVLVAGISFVQLSQNTSSDNDTESNTYGLVAVAIACCTSGLAGVYFEKILKSSKASVWIRNIQLALLGTALGLQGVYFRDRSEILEKGFFYGYTTLVWFVILLQAIGGLIVAFVVKYADNVLKGFATSVSIVLSAVASMLLLNFQPDIMFVVGASLVGLAVYAYAIAPSVGSIKKNPPEADEPTMHDQHTEDNRQESGHARKVAISA